MKFTVWFSEAGLPKTGLTPIISILQVSDQSDVTPSDNEFIEIGLGFYFFDFSESDNTEDYVALADSVTLTGPEKYAPCITEVQGEISFIKDMRGGRWRVVGDQMIYYKEDNLTEVARFDLFDVDGNPAMTAIYDRTRV
jgi:hypothetical protein